MKKIIYKLVLPLSWLAWAGTALAEAPRTMTLQYDLGTQTLAVEAYHTTDKRYEHYINRYVVMVNGGTAASFYQQGQDSTGVALKSMPIKAKAGDTLEVIAYCNEKGSLKGILYLTDEYKLQDTSVYKSSSDSQVYDQQRHRLKYDDHYIRPYFGQHHDHTPDEDQLQDSKTETKAPVPETDLSPAKQHQLDVEEEINRKAFEAKFGPLQNPDKTQK